MSEGSGGESEAPYRMLGMRRAWWCGGMVGRDTSRLSRADWVDDYASRNYLWSGGATKVANVNEDVSEIFVYPRGVRPYAQVVSGEVHCGPPAFERNWLLATDCRIAHKVKED